jgi:hypothetical protein
MGQCKSKDQDFKKEHGTVQSLRAKTVREIKENMGQSESKERDFKEQKRRL